MLKLLPRELFKSLKECVTSKAFHRERFDGILAAQKRLHSFRRELIAVVYRSRMIWIERRRGRQIDQIRKVIR